MNQEEEAFIKEQQARLLQAQAEVQNSQLQNQGNQLLMQEQEKSMIKDQLDLTEELERIEHLLKGEVIERDDNGNYSWTKPKDSSMIILSDYGIHLILNTINWYINKNTLLSNYDDETILQKMEDFATELADTVFMEYEKVFKYPSFQECKDILDQRIQTKTDLRVYANDLIGKESDKVAIKKEYLDELEGLVAKEIEKIKQQIIKNKLKRFMLLMRVVQDAVHSTYLRALQGQERRSLRQHMHISETKGLGTGLQQQQRGGLLSWFQRR